MLDTDASDIAIGAVLSQKLEGGECVIVGVFKYEK